MTTKNGGQPTNEQAIAKIAKMQALLAKRGITLDGDAAVATTPVVVDDNITDNIDDIAPKGKKAKAGKATKATTETNDDRYPLDPKGEF